MKAQGNAGLLVLTAVIVACFLAHPPSSIAMDQASFSKLLNDMKAEDFDDDKMVVLKTAASNNTFTCDQVVKVLGLFDFGEDKIAALRVMKPKITDAKNKFSIIKAFEFDDEKELASKILSDLKDVPAAPPAKPDKPAAEPPQVKPVPSMTPPGPPAGAGVLFAYKLKTGDVHGFSLKSKDSVSVKMPMAGTVRMLFESDIRFRMEILQTRPDGSAFVRFQVEKMAVSEGGAPAMDVAGVPQKDLEILAIMDRFGKVEFLRLVRVMVSPEGKRSFAVIKRADIKAEDWKAGASATARVGDEEVTISGEVDFRTGQVKASVETRKTSEQKQQDKDEALQGPGFDLIPRSLFDVLKMPEEYMGVGQRLVIKMPMIGEIDTCLKDFFATPNGNVGRLLLSWKPAKDDGKGGMPGMPPMPGMGEDDDEPGMPGMPGSHPATMPVIQMSGELFCLFNVDLGILDEVGGWIGAKIKMGMGMEWENKSEYSVVRKK